MKLDAATAGRLAAIALGHVTREYPHKLDHVLLNDEDGLPPRLLHPIFYGSFDWHSCVHGWWTLLTLKRLFPAMEQAEPITRLANESFTFDKVAAELAYLERPFSGGFERPYGWGWFLYLHLEASRHAGSDWAMRLEPLARAFATRLGAYLSKLTYPIRVGTHFNSAFANCLALAWARQFDPGLAGQIRDWTSEAFLQDRDCQAWEPGGDEFLSPALIEAMCMSRVLPAGDFDCWFAAFLPGLKDGRPASLLRPASVSDRSDGKIAHLDGLNLSRAWCFRSLAGRVSSPARPVLLAAADVHLDAALDQVSGDYMGEHWLASFALLALLADEAE